MSGISVGKSWSEAWREAIAAGALFAAVSIGCLARAGRAVSIRPETNAARPLPAEFLTTCRFGDASGYISADMHIWRREDDGVWRRIGTLKITPSGPRAETGAGELPAICE